MAKKSEKRSEKGRDPIKVNKDQLHRHIKRKWGEKDPDTGKIISEPTIISTAKSSRGMNIVGAVWKDESDGEELFGISVRASKGMTPIDFYCDSSEEAFRILGDMDNEVKSLNSLQLSKHKKSAHSLIKKKESLKTGDVYSLRNFPNITSFYYLYVLGYELSFGFKMTCGFEYVPSKSKGEDGIWSNAQNILVPGLDFKILSATEEMSLKKRKKASPEGESDEDFDPTQDYMTYADYKDSLKLLLKEFLNNSNHERYSANTMIGYFSSNICHHAKIGASYLGHKFTYLVDHISLIQEDMIQYILDNTDSETETRLFSSTNSHDFLEADDIRKLIEFTAKRKPLITNACLLALTTGLRPEEFDRLLKAKAAGVLDGNSGYVIGDWRILNYKDRELTTKTLKLTKKSINNPMLSILATVLLRYYPMPELSEWSSAFNLRNGFIRKNKATQDIYPRRFRVTTGFMLGRSTKVRDHSMMGVYDDIMRRLGHVDLTQAFEVYAKYVPRPELFAESYFKFIPFTMSGHNVCENYVIYDNFLTELFLQVLPEKARKTFKERYIEEWKQRELERSVDIPTTSKDY